MKRFSQEQASPNIEIMQDKQISEHKTTYNQLSMGNSENINSTIGQSSKIAIWS